MLDTKPLSHVCSTLYLNSYQREEFERTSLLYNRVYNELLEQYYSYIAKKDITPFNIQDCRFIERCSRELPRRRWLNLEEDRMVAEHAACELIRNLKERAVNGLPPACSECPITKYSDEVVFYWGYDVKVKDHTARMPVLGKASTGRFRYFSGSIRAIGVRRDSPQEIQCVVYYRDNEKEDTEAAQPVNIWQIGADPIPQSPLNQRLRAAGIGFMP